MGNPSWKSLVARPFWWRETSPRARHRLATVEIVKSSIPPMVSIRLLVRLRQPSSIPQARRRQTYSKGLKV
jgi:hypothetical protein